MAEGRDQSPRSMKEGGRGEGGPGCHPSSHHAIPPHHPPSPTSCTCPLLRGTAAHGSQTRSQVRQDRVGVWVSLSWRSNAAKTLISGHAPCASQMHATRGGVMSTNVHPRNRAVARAAAAPPWQRKRGHRDHGTYIRPSYGRPSNRARAARDTAPACRAWYRSTRAPRLVTCLGSVNVANKNSSQTRGAVVPLHGTSAALRLPVVIKAHVRAPGVGKGQRVILNPYYYL